MSFYEPVPKFLVDEMFEFLSALPPQLELEWVKDRKFLKHFEATRFLIIRQMMLHHGLKGDGAFDILDVGYLHGLMPEFIHRNFPKARVTVIDRPASPVFHDPTYQAMIRSRDYLRLLPCDLKDAGTLEKKFDMILLGEVIEHLDPTMVTAVLQNFRKLIKPEGVLIITTPNAAGFYNSYMMMQCKGGIMQPPIPDKTMGYGHIHLWNAPLLEATANYAGWKPAGLQYFHGLEGRMFADLNEKIGSIKGQLTMRFVKFLANRHPERRGFFVESFTPIG